MDVDIEITVVFTVEGMARRNPNITTAVASFPSQDDGTLQASVFPFAFNFIGAYR